MSEPKQGSERPVIFRVRRYDPESGRGPFFQEYEVPYSAGMVVLDGIWYIKENLDPTLAWRSSCRMGVCGSCGMLVNGRPVLACNTQVAEVGRERIEVAPLPNFTIVRDLVPELGSMFQAHAGLLPHIVRRDSAEMANPSDQYLQTPAELVEYLQFSYCIKCGCCLSACPTVATDPHYSGPQPLAQAYRYSVDSRDDGFAARLPVLTGEAGPWRCHYAGECSRACPKGVDPARAIQLLKRQLVLDSVGLSKLGRRKPAQVKPKELVKERREDIPDPPPYTVEA